MHLERNLSFSNFGYMACITDTTSFPRRNSLNPASESTTPNFCRSFSVSSRLFFPNTSIVPPSVWISPRAALNVVDFPAPFCPISPVIHPGLTSSEQSSVKFLYCFFTCSNFSMCYPSNISSNISRISSSGRPYLFALRITSVSSSSTSRRYSSIIISLLAAAT